MRIDERLYVIGMILQFAGVITIFFNYITTLILFIIALFFKGMAWISADEEIERLKKK